MQQRISETITQFYSDSDDLAPSAYKYKQICDEIDEATNTELDDIFRTTVLEPLGRLLGVFPDFNESMKKRHKKLLDYDMCRSKVKKLAEKPSDDPSKFPRVIPHEFFDFSSCW